MNLETGAPTPVSSSISKRISNFFGQKNHKAVLASVIIQKPAGQILNSLFDYDVLMQVLPDVKNLVFKGDDQISFSLSVTDVEEHNSSIEVLRESLTSLKWEFSYASGVHKGSLLLSELPFDSGTMVSLISESSDVNLTTLEIIKGIFSSSRYPSSQEALRKFKALIECDQIATTEGQPRGNRV